MSKSLKIHRMLSEQEDQRPTRGRRRRRRQVRSSDGDDDGAAETEIEEEEAEPEQQQVRTEGEGDGQPYCIAFPDFPGGPGTFEAAAKFCYGVRVDLTPWNVAPLRCAAEYLEMTEDHAEDNLAARAEAYLDQAVLRHPGDATKALKSCEELLPLAEDLGIVSRCVEAIAARSSSASRSWFDDLAVLGLRMYKRVMAAMAARGDVRAEARESCLVSYARGTIPGLSRSMRRRLASAPVSSEVEQKELLEAVVASLPADKCSGRVVTAKFLFALLRTAHILRASDAARAALERKAATQLQQAALEDVLIPSYSGTAETLYDVDCVQRIVRYFLAEEELGGEASSSAAIEEEEAVAVARPSAVVMVQVGKLVDNYLAEVASDANLKPAKFCDLALSLPDHARIYDDGVYRAVDIYLKVRARSPRNMSSTLKGQRKYVSFRAVTLTPKDLRLFWPPTDWLLKFAGAPAADSGGAGPGGGRGGLPEADGGGVHARGAERAAPAAGGPAGALLRAAAAPARHRGHAPGALRRRRSARGCGVARRDGAGAGQPGAAAGHGQHGEPGAGSGARVLQHAQGHQEDRRARRQRQRQPVPRRPQRGRVQARGGRVEGAARVQIQHAGVRLARAQRGGVQGVQDGDEPVATARAVRPSSPSGALGPDMGFLTRSRFTVTHDQRDQHGKRMAEKFQIFYRSKSQHQPLRSRTFLHLSFVDVRGVMAICSFVVRVVSPQMGVDPCELSCLCRREGGL
jgi:hypothetical protein